MGHCSERWRRARNADSVRAGFGSLDRRWFRSAHRLLDPLSLQKMRVSLEDVELFFDVEGPRLVPDGPAMREHPTVIALHSGPGPDEAVRVFLAAYAVRP
jgi:hypothetical protein